MYEPEEINNEFVGPREGLTVDPELQGNCFKYLAGLRKMDLERTGRMEKDIRDNFPTNKVKSMQSKFTGGLTDEERTNG